MSEGDDHRVAGGVGKAVQDDEAVLAAVDNAGFFVGKFRQLAKDALIAIGMLSCGCDVCISPGRPQVIHKNLSSDRPIIRLQHC